MMAKTPIHTYDYGSYYDSINNDDEILNAPPTRSEELISLLADIGIKIKEQVLGNDKKFLEDKTHTALFLLAVLVSLVSLTSYNCNKDAILELCQDLEETHGIVISETLIAWLQQLAGVGGTLSNMILSFVGTMSLRGRFNTLLSSLQKGQRHYFLAYTAIIGSAIFAAGSNGLVVATEAPTALKALFDFLANFLASLGPHMLFSIPLVGLITRSPIGDVLNIPGSLLNMFCHKKDGEQKQVNSVVFNASSRLIQKTGYRLSSLSVGEQVEKIMQILSGLNKKPVTNKISIVNDTDTDAEEQNNENDNIVETDMSDEESVFPISSFDIWRQNAENTGHPRVQNSKEAEKVAYLLYFYSELSKLPLEDQVNFFLTTAKVLKLPYEASVTSLLSILVNTAAVPFFAFTCLTNLTNLNIFGQKFTAYFTPQIEAQKIVGGLFAGFAAPAKIGMYVSSGLSMIMRLYFLIETLLWLWQACKTHKIFIPLIGIIATVIGLLSGACYALDARNLEPDALEGLLAYLFNVLGEEAANIALTAFTLVAWSGAGIVNANALITVAVDIIGSLIHLLHPVQKARDASSEIATKLTNKLIGNMVPASPSGKNVSETMFKHYHEIESPLQAPAEPEKNKRNLCLTFFTGNQSAPTEESPLLTKNERNLCPFFKRSASTLPKKETDKTNLPPVINDITKSESNDPVSPQSVNGNG